MCNLRLCHVDHIDRDIDESNLISLLLIAQDHGTPPRTAVTTVVVNITGVNDNEPQFALPEKTITVMEGEIKTNIHTAVVSQDRV